MTPHVAEKTAMGEVGRKGFHKQYTYVPSAADPAVCSFVYVQAFGRQGPPLSTQGPRLAILKYQGSDPTQPYPTFVVRQSATLLYGFAPQRQLRRCSVPADGRLGENRFP
jgi:hypothetical protein